MSLSQQEVLEELRARIAAIERGDSFSSGLEVTVENCVRSKGKDSIPCCAKPAADADSRAKGITPRKKPAQSPLAHQDFRNNNHGESAFGLRDAIRKIERLCAVKERATAQLRERLIRDGFPEEVAEEAVGRAVSCGLVDDMRYADALVRTRLASGKGCAGIARELNGLGIDPSSVESLQEAESQGDETEVERALALLRKRPPRARNARDAAYRRLLGKGFSSSVCSSAARLWWEESQDGRESAYSL